MTHSFHLDRTSVCIYASYEGKQIKKATGLRTQPALWNNKGKSLRARCKDERIYEKLRIINARLLEKEALVSSYNDALDAIDYALDIHVSPRKKNRPTFWEYFEEWGNRESSSKRQRGLAVRKVAQLMGTNDDWEDIDSSYWFRLQRKMEDEGYSVNYRWNIGARLKVAMHEGHKMKYHNNTDYQEFRAKKEQTEAIALSPDEIELLWNYQPKYELYRKSRDLFLIGYYTGSRFSDYSRLSMDNVHDGVVEFYQQKTDDKVIIPASPRLIELLERNGGESPKINHVVFNRYIKKVCEDCGINGVVQLSKAKRKSQGEKTYRYELVSSHTARRSLLTNLYQSGVSAKDCMAISGHKSLTSFQTYLRVSNDESLSRVKDNPIFK